MTPVLVQKRDGIATITLNRPNVRNAIDMSLATGLADALHDLADSRVVVLRGAGPAFCAGGDVGEVEARRAAGREALTGLFTAVHAAVGALTDVPVPVVAVVHGDAMAGGFEIVQACDIVIASTTARLSDMHLRFGHVPGGGSTQRLPRLVGRARAMGLVLTSDVVTGADAERIGLVYRAVEPERLEDYVRTTVRRLVNSSREALATAKRLVRLTDSLPLEAGLDAERAAVVDHLLGPAGDAALAAFVSRTRTGSTP